MPWFDQFRADVLNRPDPVCHALLAALYPLAARDSAAADQARREREDALQRSEQYWADQERQRQAGSPGMPRAIDYSSIVSGVMLVIFIVAVQVTHNVANGVVNGLVGVVVAGLIFVIEGRLARQLGPTTQYYPATAGWGRGLQRAGSHVHGVGRGCLLLIALLVVVPTLIGLAFSFPFVVYALMGVWQLRSVAGGGKPGSPATNGSTLRSWDVRREWRVGGRCRRGRRGVGAVALLGMAAGASCAFVVGHGLQALGSGIGTPAGRAGRVRVAIDGVGPCATGCCGPQLADRPACRRRWPNRDALAGPGVADTAAPGPRHADHR